MRKPADSINDGFDAAYYALTQPDVAAAGIDALTHFNTLGWQEFRNPNGLFDVAYYLAQNSDVADAGLNPLTHYMVYGAAEGRNPSASFNTSAYLAANSDVADAGVNALQHYLSFGAFEGRSGGVALASGTAGADFLVGTGGGEVINAGAGNDFVIAAGGNDSADGGAGIDTARFSSNFSAYTFAFSGEQVTVTGPDGQTFIRNFERFAFRDGTIERNDANVLIDDFYYYALNPDVFAAGVDAATHYATFGWKEGRNPNSYFDTNYYLSNNPDVGDAGVNPLEHYLNFGAGEGRNPSGAFDSAAYLSANPDVAAAGLNPLLHFLACGQYEGRSPLGEHASVVDAGGATLSYTENQAATAIASSLTVTDSDSDTLVGATVSITVNFASGQDVLGFVDQNGISGVYNAGNGVLTLSGEATVAEYQAALRSVTYSNSSENPSGSTRTISYQVNDGAASNTAAATISVAPVNDVPAGANATFTINEDTPRSFTSADFGITDAEGHALASIKITALSLNGGTLTLVTDGDPVAVTLNQVINAGDIGGLVFRPAADASGVGNASFAFQVQDSGGTANGGVDLDPSANTSTFNVTAVNDGPRNIQFSQNGTLPEGTVATDPFGVVGTVTATDIEGNTGFTYSLVDSFGGAFAINASGQITVAATNPLTLDFEANESHTVELVVRVTDNGSPAAFTDKTINITLADVVELQASAIEGYIANAQVFVDENDDGDYDVGEYTITTDSVGGFKIIGNHGVHDIYLIGGGGAVDTATGLAFTGILRAPPGSTVLSPITTLMAALIEANPALSATDAKDLLVANLGIPDVDYTTFDPVSESVNGNLQGDAAFAAGVQVYTTIIQTSSLITGASGGAVDTGAAAAGAITALAAQIAGGAVDLKDAATLETIVNNAGSEVSVDVTATAADAATVISNSNTVIDNAAGSGVALLTAVAQAATIAQGEAASALGTDPSAAAGTYTTAEVGDRAGDVVVDAEALQGPNGDNDLTGTAGADILDGQGGNDNLFAGGGKDVLIGGAGTDVLYGDTLVASQASRVMGADRADYSGAVGRISVQLASGVVTEFAADQTTQLSQDTLVSVEFVTGSAFADTFVATGFSPTSTNNGGVGYTFNTGIGALGNVNQFEGKDGNDTVTGNGTTRVSYQSATDDVTVHLQNNTAFSTNGGNAAGIGVDTFVSGVNAVRGSAHNDTITGRNDNGNSTETFEGLAGNDFIDGNGGFDRVRYDFDSSGATGITIDLGAGTVTGAAIGTDTLRSIEFVRASNGDDSYDASTFSAVSINGGGQGPGPLNQGNFNEFEGLSGNDTIKGNFNTRVAYYNATSGVTITFTGAGVGTASGDGSVGVDTFTGGVSWVRGSNFGDTITGYNNGTAGFEQLEGWAGDDLINGGLGLDTARYDGNNGDQSGRPMGTNGLAFNLGAGTSTAIDGIGSNADFNYGSDTLRGIESIRGTNSNDTYDASGYATSSLNAGTLGLFDVAAFNVFEGGGGNDVVTGNGNTRVNYQNSGSAVQVTLGNGGATGGQGTDDFTGGVNAVRGSNFDDKLTGTNNTDPATTELFEGMGGNDTINGLGGFDNARYENHNTGGFGISVMRNGGSSTVTRINPQANDGVGTDTLINIEAVRGTNFADTYDATGFSGFNDFTGMGGIDTIKGNGDTRISYHTATGNVIVDLAAGTANGFQGADVLQGGIDAVRGSMFSDEIRGSNRSDALTGGNDTLTGLGGSDQFKFLNTEFGNDTILDFVAGAGTDDVLQLETDVFVDFANVMSKAVQIGNDVLITMDANNSIRLSNVTLGNLHFTDFMFV